MKVAESSCPLRFRPPAIQADRGAGWIFKDAAGVSSTLMPAGLGRSPSIDGSRPISWSSFFETFAQLAHRLDHVGPGMRMGARLGRRWAPR